MKTKKRVVQAVSIVAICIAVTGCGGKQQEKIQTTQNVQTEEQEAQWIGSNLKYDVNSVVNNGEKIELTLWTDPEVEPFYKEAIDKYTKIHPNVSFDIVSQPWSDYWTKLPLALNAGSGPDIYRAAFAFISNLAPYSYELPEDIFPREELKADYPEIENILFNGKLYSIPLGSQSNGGVYYNKGMWEEAGLTDADIPKTLDDFAEVGKKLTKRDEKGNVITYGYSIDHTFEEVLPMLNYIKGETLFQEDQYTWNLDNDTTYENIAMLKKFIDEDGFMMYTDGDCEDQFGHGQTAMISQSIWVGGYLNETYPEIKWGFFMMPTTDGKTPPAYDKKMYEWTLAVSAKDEAKRAVAFDFMKYYIAEEETLLKHTIRVSAIPAKLSMKDNETIRSLPNLSVLAQNTDRLVFLGSVPTDEACRKALRGAGSDIFINGKDPKQVIKKIQADIMEDTKKNKIEYKTLEDQYPFYDEFK